MSDTEIIKGGLCKLLKYIESQNYRGYDPYDALKSPLFRLPVLRSNKTLRFGFQQLIKRLPFNIRSLLAIPKGYNPVTLGLCIQGYSYLINSSGFSVQSSDCQVPGAGSLPPSAFRLPPIQDYLKSIDLLIEELKKLVPSGYHGACWGYDFPWEAKYSSIPAYQPTVVATGIISNALFECYKITGNEKAKELCISSMDFVLSDLSRTYEGDSYCFSYSPFDKQQVFNANMKGARLLAQVYSLSHDDKLKTAAGRAVKYVINNQNTDGSWFYSKSGKGIWIDNYHTGYILDCLDEYTKLTGASDVSDALEKGYGFYRTNFFESGGRPKFYSDRLWPVDCTAAAQSILTLCRFDDIEMAKNVTEYMIRNMQSPAGGFYFRNYKYRTEKTIFMRWSNAWMYASLSYLLMQFAISNPKSEINKSEAASF